MRFKGQRGNRKERTKYFQIMYKYWNKNEKTIDCEHKNKFYKRYTASNQTQTILRRTEKEKEKET